MARSLLAAFMLCLIFVCGISLANPISYITEKASRSLDYNGTVLNSTNEGSIEVGMSDVRDVLQNVVITLSTIQGTNIINTTAYAAVAASPDLGDKTKLYLTTNESNSTTKYSFNGTFSLGFQMDYDNEAGGKDLRPGENALSFRIRLNSSTNVSGVRLTFQARRNVLNGADSVNITESSCTTGGTTAIDSDADGFYDRLTWIGDISGSAEIYLTANITGGINYDSNELYVSLDSDQTRLNYTQPSTFSGIAFSSRFSRANVRQGVEITPKDNWNVRGFMKNICHDVIYVVEGWALYPVGSETPSIQNMTGTNLFPGQTLYTENYDTGVYTNGSPLVKAIYYSAFFNWQVIWGASVYEGVLEDKISMPTLYQIDAFADKRISLVANRRDNTILGITDEIQHIGSNNLEIGRAVFNVTTNDTWQITGIYGYIRNGTIITPINISSVLNTEGNYTITIENISLAQNEFLDVVYNLSRPGEISNKNYVFNMTATAWTKSGTPVEKEVMRNIYVPTPFAPGGGGGGGGGGGEAPKPENILEIVREDSESWFVSESVLFNNLSFSVIDTGGKGLRNFMFLIYAPPDSSVDMKGVHMLLTRKGRVEEVGITVKAGEILNIGNDTYRQYMIQTSADPAKALTLNNGDRVNLNYFTELTFGTSKLITRAYGYNYYKDAYFYEDIETYARREYWNIKNLVIKESFWENLNIEVGKPVRWIKTIEVTNPNERAVKQRYSSKIIGGLLSLHIKLSENLSTREIEHNEEGNRTDFIIDIMEKKYQTYILELTTPPVLEVKHETQIREIKSDSVVFDTVIVLKNFADMEYENISYYMPKTEILSSNYNYTDAGENMRIIIPSMKAGENVTIILTTQERPPKVIINLDKLSYKCRDKAQANIIVVPNSTNGYLELELAGPEESGSMIYADMISIDKTPTNANLTIPIVKCDSGNYTLYAFYRLNFQTLLATKENVEITCSENQEISWLIFLIISVIVVVIARKLIYREKNIDRELEKIGR